MLWRNVKDLSIGQERKCLGIQRWTRKCKWKDGSRYYWSFKKQSNAITEIIFSVMAGSVCSKSCNTSTCFNEAMHSLWWDGMKFYVFLLIISYSTWEKQQEDFCSCFSKNKTLKSCEISFLLEMEDLVHSEDLRTGSDIVSYKYARLMSCGVECTFVQYRSIFCDNWHSIMIHNLKMTFMVHCNNASLSVWDTDDSECFFM